MYSTEVIPNERDAAEVTRGMQLENPVVAYNAPITDQPRFVEESFADDPADQNAHLPTLAALGVALLAALIFGLVRHSAVFGVSVFAAILTIAIPAFALLASNLSLYIDDKRFSRKGSAILGHRAVEQSAYINTFAIDSKDIFTKDSCHIIGIKTFHNMRIDDAILYAAALVIGSEGPLADEFQNAAIPYVWIRTEERNVKVLSNLMVDITHYVDCDPEELGITELVYYPALREILLQYQDNNDPEALAELIRYAYAIATRYGEGAAALSAEMYDALAELSGATVAPAVAIRNAVLNATGIGFNEFPLTAQRLVHEFKEKNLI